MPQKLVSLSLSVSLTSRANSSFVSVSASFAQASAAPDAPASANDGMRLHLQAAPAAATVQPSTLPLPYAPYLVHRKNGCRSPSFLCRAAGRPYTTNRRRKYRYVLQ